MSGVIGYRRELAGQRGRILKLGVASVIGGAVGAVMLLALPAEAFSAIVPVLIGLGCVLILFQPAINRRLAAPATSHGEPKHGPAWVRFLVLLAAVYGGYFGAAQGVLIMAILGIGIRDSLQRLNGTKNVLAGLTNAVAAVVFIAVADVDWVVALIAAGSVIGGQLGALVGRRLPPLALRLFALFVGVVAIVSLLVN